MIGRKSDKSNDVEVEGPRGFDDFSLCLGDIMRGERATMGKSLLDVQRELRIKAAYIAAIENADPDAFDTPGFIAGYVRSYARYLNMDPDIAFKAFCDESGFEVAHGMSKQASGGKKAGREDRAPLRTHRDVFGSGATPFVPEREGFWSRVEPGAIGSMLVLVGLIGAIGFGGFTVLKEVQRVQVAPVEQTPQVLADLDPLENAVTRSANDTSTSNVATGDVLNQRPSADALDRLYRPQALDVPVLVARDAPIATIDPRNVGSFSQRQAPDRAPVVPIDTARLGAAGLDTAGIDAADADDALPAAPAFQVPQVVEETAPALVIVASAETWVRVRSADGTTIYETIMKPGDSWEAPLTEQPPTLRTGNAGGVYFAMGGKFFGPVGGSGEVRSNLSLSVAGLQETLVPADVQSEDGLVRYAEAQGLLPAVD